MGEITFTQALGAVDHIEEFIRFAEDDGPRWGERDIDYWCNVGTHVLRLINYLVSHKNVALYALAKELSKDLACAFTELERSNPIFYSNIADDDGYVSIVSRPFIDLVDTYKEWSMTDKEAAKGATRAKEANEHMRFSAVKQALRYLDLKKYNKTEIHYLLEQAYQKLDRGDVQWVRWEMELYGKADSTLKNKVPKMKTERKQELDYILQDKMRVARRG